MSADRLYYLIERLGILLRADVRRNGKVALQPIQHSVLEYLAHCNRLSDTPAAVTEFLQLTKGTVSQTLGVLARRKLITKHRDETDRRVVHLALTAAGRRAVARPGPVWRKACAALGAGELSRASAALEALVRAGRLASAVRSFGDCYSCRLLRTDPGGRYRCDFNGEPLTPDETRRICRQHVPD